MSVRLDLDGYTSDSITLDAQYLTYYQWTALLTPRYGTPSQGPGTTDVTVLHRPDPPQAYIDRAIRESLLGVIPLADQFRPALPNMDPNVDGVWDIADVLVRLGQ